MSSSLIIFQRIRVISSPSISTSGVVMAIFFMGTSIRGGAAVYSSGYCLCVLVLFGIVVNQAAVEDDSALLVGKAGD